MEVYNNNDVSIEIERVDIYESKVNVNGRNLIWISRSNQEEFIEELKGLFEQYKI